MDLIRLFSHTMVVNSYVQSPPRERAHRHSMLSHGIKDDSHTKTLMPSESPVGIPRPTLSQRACATHRACAHACAMHHACSCAMHHTCGMHHACATHRLSSACTSCMCLSANAMHYAQAKAVPCMCHTPCICKAPCMRHAPCTCHAPCMYMIT